jgi:general secretion pathway protein D
VLNQLILETTTKEDKAGKIVETQKVKRMEEDIVIIPDPMTYSLIVYASKRNQQWISSLIKQLDQYRPQVLLDVTLVEITKNEKFDLDLDAEVFSGLPILSLSSTTGAIGGKSVTAFYKSEDVHVLLEALQEKGYGRILARPKLLVNDNEEGIIKSEEKTSVAEIRTIIIPGTGVSPSTASQDVTFKSYAAGITLTITPHISKGDQLGLSITLTRSDFRLRDPTKITTIVEDKAETSSFPTPPDLLTSDVTTNVTVPDGATIILGGLERIRQSKGGTKVPLLGDIPFIGGLFRTTSNQDDQSRLYVFVRATIIRPGEEMTGVSDIEMVSAKNRATFEKYEAEMQQYEDWPGIKPKPMDPLKILETK